MVSTKIFLQRMTQSSGILKYLLIKLVASLLYYEPNNSLIALRNVLDIEASKGEEI